MTKKKPWNWLVTVPGFLLPCHGAGFRVDYGHRRGLAGLQSHLAPSQKPGSQKPRAPRLGSGEPWGAF